MTKNSPYVLIDTNSSSEDELPPVKFRKGNDSHDVHVRDVLKVCIGNFMNRKRGEGLLRSKIELTKKLLH